MESVKKQLSTFFIFIFLLAQYLQGHWISWMARSQPFRYRHSHHIHWWQQEAWFSLGKYPRPIIIFTWLIILQQSFYATLNALDRRSCSEGYRLLHVICTYLELDSLLGLGVHMERTIAMIKNKLLVFGAALKVNCLLLLKTYHWHRILRTMLIRLLIHPPWKASRKTGTFQRRTFGNTCHGTSKWKVLHATTARALTKNFMALWKPPISFDWTEKMSLRRYHTLISLWYWLITDTYQSYYRYFALIITSLQPYCCEDVWTHSTNSTALRR